MRLFCGKENQGIDTAELLQRLAHGFFKTNAALGVLFDEMRDDFGVGLGDELVAFALELLLQLEVIFDDAVVDDYDLAAAIAVRMCVFLGRATMGGPAGVADSVGALDRRFLQYLFEVAEFSGRAANFEFAFFRDDRDARGVVPAVFKFAQAFNDDRDDLFGSDVADYSAHAGASPRAGNPP